MGNYHEHADLDRPADVHKLALAAALRAGAAVTHGTLALKLLDGAP